MRECVIDGYRDTYRPIYICRMSLIYISYFGDNTN